MILKVGCGGGQFSQLFNIKSAIYCNYDDIRWQTILSSMITSSIGNNGKLLNYFRSKDFNNQNFFKSYFCNYDCKSPYESFFVHHTKIICDICGKLVSLKTDSVFWHNDYCGDLCSTCFSEKKNKETKRIKYLKYIILLQGKKEIFNRELKSVKTILKDINLKKINLEKQNKLLININNELMKKNEKKNNCSICFDLLNNNISAGRCGHCSHTKCLELVSDTCPMCRVKTKFFKLYL